MRIQKRVGQPRVQQLLAGARFGIHRIRFALPRGHVRCQRSVITGMQHVVRRDFRELHGEIRAIAIGDGMQHYVNLLEQGVRHGVGGELLAQLIDMAGAGDFVGVLASAIKDRRLSYRP